jgi:hypothetical protein
MERASSNLSVLVFRGVFMEPESAIIERVEVCVRHPVFEGSDRTMDLVIADLQTMADLGRIPQATYRELRAMILRSPHIVSGR